MRKLKNFFKYLYHFLTSGIVYFRNRQGQDPVFLSEDPGHRQLQILTGEQPATEIVLKDKYAYGNVMQYLEDLGMDVTFTKMEMKEFPTKRETVVIMSDEPMIIEVMSTQVYPYFYKEFGLHVLDPVLPAEHELENLLQLSTSKDYALMLGRRYKPVACDMIRILSPLPLEEVEDALNTLLVELEPYRLHKGTPQDVENRIKLLKEKIELQVEKDGGQVRLPHVTA